MAAPPTLERVGDEVFLGRSLSGAECRLRLLARDRKPKVTRLGVFCAGRKAAAGEVIEVARRRASPAALASDSDWQRRFAGVLACGEVRMVRILGDVSAALRRCTALDGGWPNLALAAHYAGRTYLMTGMPTIVPLLEEAMARMGEAGAGGGQVGDRGRVAERIASLEAQVGASFSLIGVQEIDAFEQLRRLGNNYNSAKDYRRAEDAWRRALEIQERLIGRDQASLGDTLAHLALNVSNQDRFDEADRLFRRAGPLIERSAHPDHRARLLVYRAFHAEQQGQYRRALDMVRASVRLRRQGETGKDALAHSLFEAARLLLKLEDPRQARKMARDALDNYQAAYGSTHWWVAATHDLLADIEKLLGDNRKARSHNGKAVAIRRVLFGPSAPLAQSYAQLADILTAEGRRGDALAAYRRMAEILLANPDARDGVGPAPITAYILAALRQAARDPRRRAGLRAEAFVASQLVRGGAAAQAIDLMAARLASGSVEIAGKIKSLQDARERLDGLRQALAAEMSKPTKLRDAESEDRLKREIKQQAEAIQAIDAALEAEHPRYYQLIAPRPLDPAAVAALLRPDEALVSFFVGEDATVVFLVRDGAVRANAVDLSRQDLTTVVTELRAGVDWVRNSGADFDTRLSQKLHQILLGGFAAELAGVAHLIFVPAGPLMSLPPAVLVTEPIKGDPTDYGSVSWLVRKHAVSVLPSVHALKAMRTQTTGSRASRPFIGFGAPNFTGQPEDDSARRALEQGCLEEPEGADRAMVRSLPRLPETSAELRTIATSLGAGANAVVLGDAASEATVREVGMRDYRVVAFATHGLLPENLNCDMEPALALTPSDTGGNESDGLLMASEIAALELDAELALLSACDTAGPGGGLAGESLSGLARAFIYAGARRVVASHWAVLSVPTVRLTTGIFERMDRAPKDGYAAALRRSQLALLNDPDMVHPVIWAPFVLIGDGGAGR